MGVRMKPRPTESEFDELKRKRDVAISASVARICHDMGLDPRTAKVSCCHSGGACYCDCPDGPCQHVWDGPEYTEESEGGGFMSSVTCSRCGTPAIYHDMRCGP